VADELIEKDCVVRNRMGVHARPAAKLVQAANKFPCEVTFSKDGQDVNGKSIMGVLLLVASQGSDITIACDGEDAQQCLSALSDLVKAGFGED
jgi:phosphocarrier protein HPr